MSERVGIGARIDGSFVSSGEPLSVNFETPRRRLIQLTRDQLDLQHSGEFDPFLEKPLNHLVASNQFHGLERAEALGVFNVKDEERYKVGMQGKIFEALTYGILSAWQPNRRAVLSPSATLDYLGTLFPRHKKIKTSNGNWTINGVYVPDGLIVEMDDQGKPRVLTAIEATVNIVEKIKDGQVGGDLLEETMAHPLMDGAKLALVFPTQYISGNILEKLGSQVCYQFPFNQADFAYVADALTDRILQGREPANDQDIADRMVYQNSRIEKGVMGPDPLPWLKYADTPGSSEITNPHID